MLSQYSFAGVVLSIRHEDDELFRSIDDEIGYYGRKEAAEADCSATFNPGPDGINIPKKAIRTYIMEGQEMYSLGERTFLAGRDNRYVIIMDFGKKEIAVHYREHEASLQNVVRWMLKWLIIKAAEGKGLAYIHASAAHYKGKTIIFSGDSHSGKSSSLLRMIQNGAKAISDDSVIFDGANLIPFTFNTSVDEDLVRRFSIKPGFNIGEHVDNRSAYGKADVVIFLRVWNNESSELRPMEYKRALLNMIRSYKKEQTFTIWANWDKDDSSKLIFERYASLLENARCFEFYAGFDEEEVRRTLFDFLDK
jgi:hypothetical protein